MKAAALSAAFSLVPTPAQAEDWVYGTRGDDSMVEREHEITLTFERGHAQLVVRRTVHNALERHDEAMFWLELPQGAVATGVRTLGSKKGKPHWYEGELLDAEEAAARYQELTGMGGWHPKDPVLLSWRDPTLLLMQVFPVEPEADKTVEYTLSMPATWQDGRWRIELPAMGSSSFAADVTVSPKAKLDQLFVDGGAVAGGYRLALDQPAVIELVPHDPDRVTLALASLDVGEDRHLVRIDVALAPEISQLPERARIVVALDLSRSRRPDAIAAQRRAAIAYLEHFRDPALAAEAAVIGFDREVRDLTNAFVPAEQAIAMLEQVALDTRNGSEIGEALARASALLAEHAPARAPRRIVLMTDFHTASRLTPAGSNSTVDRSKAIVHLAGVEVRSPYLNRDDGHPWAKLAARSEGVLWKAGVPIDEDPDTLVKAREVFEAWARPVEIDDFQIDVEGLRFVDADRLDLGLSLQESIHEGEGLERMALSSSAARELQVTGKLWNTPFEQRVRVSTGHGDRWSAWVFGSELLDELSESQMRVLATRGEVVSPVTSYLAIEPGVRPSTAGIEAWERARELPVTRVGRAIVRDLDGTGWLSAFNPHTWLSEQLSQAWQACRGDQPAKLAIETTFAEIVDVGITLTPPAPALEACMRESVWAIELPARFDSSFETWTFELP